MFIENSEVLVFGNLVFRLSNGFDINGKIWFGKIRLTVDNW